LGGHLLTIRYLLGEKDDPKEKLSELVKEVEANPKIHVYTDAEVVDVYGFVGNFKSKIRQQNGAEKEVEYGIVIVATGAAEYQPTEYFYNKDPRVVTQHELEQDLAEGEFNAKNVVMIQCIGARTKENPNLSATIRIAYH